MTDFRLGGTENPALDNAYYNPASKLSFKRALISVYDKTGLVELAQGLAANGVEIISTGSTAATIAAAGVKVTPVQAVTGFPECLGGRVKTLHPAIHGGILANRQLPEHMQQLADLDITPIDLVVCNLYPFNETVMSGASYSQCIEQIDIGGPSMVRAAAKNHDSVAIVTDPTIYPLVVQAAASGGFDFKARRVLAGDAFAHTARYDTMVADWFRREILRDEVSADFDAGEMLPLYMNFTYERADELRYGENPHQQAALYVDLQDGKTGGVATAKQLSGKAMSFNNYTDSDAALRAAYDHEDPCVAIIKHANPCGIACGANVAQAHRRAHACDPVSAYGGVIATNVPVTVQMAEQVLPIFTEVILAPGYEAGAAELLAQKKNLRVLVVDPPMRNGYEVKKIGGGLLLQEADDVNTDGDNSANWTLVSGEVADEQTQKDLEFAWRSIRAVRSNAILVAKDQATVGIGMGQVNRVDSCRLAVERANTLGGRSTGDAAADKVDSAGGARAEDLTQADAPLRCIGSVAASDAFFPFADGLQLLIDAGVKAVVQPGGSVRDAEVIEAAQAAGITMYLTGTRHFTH